MDIDERILTLEEKQSDIKSKLKALYTAKKKQTTKKFLLEMPEDLYDWLEMYAKETGQYKAGVIRNALEDMR